MVGKVWSAFQGAVRTYQPGLDFENDSPFAHPRVLMDRVISWQYKERFGERALASFLVDRLHEQAATKRVDWGGCMFFAEAHPLRAAIERERIRREIEAQWSQGNNASALRIRIEEMERAHDEEAAALKSENQALAEEREDWFQTAVEAERERDSVRRENRNLQLQNDQLRTAIKAKSGTSADADTPIPDNYGDLPDWVQECLTGRLCLYRRAVRGLKDARYEEIGLVYQCLLLLAGEYRDMKLGLHENAKEAFQHRRKELGLELGPSIAKERAGEQGDTYFVHWKGERRFLESHLCKGDDRDPRHCLRMYFFWDADDRQVVVGWLPSHLDTRMT